MTGTSVNRMPSDAIRSSILVVDDEKVIAETLSMILQSVGYDAAAAYDGAAALEAVRQRLPNLVVSDVAMPGMNGVDLAIAIRRQFPSCQILLFSGHGDTPLILQDAKRRGYDFELLAKPLHPEEFLKKIKDLIGPPEARNKVAWWMGN